MRLHTRNHLWCAALLTASACTSGADENSIVYDEPISRTPTRDGGTMRFDAGLITEALPSSSTSLVPQSSSVVEQPASTASSQMAAPSSSDAPDSSAIPPPSSAPTSLMSSSSSLATPSSSATPPSSSAPHVDAFVYAHSDVTLYRLDADTLQVTTLGDIQWFNESNVAISGGDQMTDLAVNSAGDAYACSFNWLYHVDIASRHARRVAPLDDSYNGLTFVPAGVLDPTREVLVGATNGSGALYRINLITGVATAIGSYGNGLISSGDVVAIQGAGMFATVTTEGASATAPDMLASINPVTGQATVIGTNTGFADLWGLGYWGGTLYGFSPAGQVVSINRTTGRGTLITTRPASFWGAGVTTAAAQ